MSNTGDANEILLVTRAKAYAPTLASIVGAGSAAIAQRHGLSCEKASDLCRLVNEAVSIFAGYPHAQSENIKIETKFSLTENSVSIEIVCNGYASVPLEVVADFYKAVEAMSMSDVVEKIEPQMRRLRLRQYVNPNLKNLTIIKMGCDTDGV